jgi:anaerobic magnesium-protoporphyrin IX monomethyl ester cyclase
MSGRVLLVFPQIDVAAAPPSHPPLGLLTVAAPLVAANIDVVVLDERVTQDFQERLAREARRGIVCAGISCMSGIHITHALRAAAVIRANSDAPIVWGGVHPSLEPRSTIAHPLVDVVVLEDGEETFLKIVQRLIAASDDLRAVPGLALKRGGEVSFTGPPVPAALEGIPRIPYELVDRRCYGVGLRETWAAEPRFVIPMETSRGCPYRCIFCTESMRKKKWRALPPERVVADIKWNVEHYGARNFLFLDDNFFGDGSRGREILELILREGLDIRWYTNMRPDVIVKAEDQLLRDLVRSGCRMLTFGAETGSERVMEMLKKQVKVSQVVEANRRLAGTGVVCHFVTIRGFPSETLEEIRATYLLNLQLLLENPNAIVDSPFLIPTPGTVMASMCLDTPVSLDLEGWSTCFHWGRENSARPPWVKPETYDFISRHRVFEDLIIRGCKVRNINAATLRLFNGFVRAYRGVLLRDGLTNRALEAGYRMMEKPRQVVGRWVGTGFRAAGSRWQHREIDVSSA